MQSEAERLKIKLDIYNADGDNARQALFLQQAVVGDDRLANLTLDVTFDSLTRCFRSARPASTKRALEAIGLKAVDSKSAPDPALLQIVHPGCAE